MNLPLEPADQHSASAEYAARFAGPIGRWMLRRQTEIVLDLIHDCQGASVLDVGGGHGQITLPLIEAGFRVHCLGSNDAALLQVRDLASQGRCQASTGDLLQLPFPNNSFDVVTCFRLLPHCAQWRELVAELCRVARRRVVLDFPLQGSINALTPLLFGMKRGFEKNTREYTLFKFAEVSQQFELNHFGGVNAEREFFWPMVLHRMLRTPFISNLLELPPRVLGLTTLFGSPVVASFHRALTVKIPISNPTLVPEACA